MATKHCCKNCHFLIKESEQLTLLPWTEDDRRDSFPRIRIPPEELKHDKLSGTASAYNMRIGCYKQIWSLEHNEFRNDSEWHRYSLRNRVTESRKNKCFFVIHHVGMEMGNAEQFYDVQYHITQSKQRVFWTLITSGVALLVSLLALGWQVYEAVFLNSASLSP